MHPIIAHLLGTGTIIGANTRELGRTKPFERSARPAEDALFEAGGKRIKQIAPNRKDPNVAIEYNEPKGFFDAFRHPNKFASVGTAIDAKGHDIAHKIQMNPHTDRSYLAHELGHVASRQTDLGRFTANLRHNPKLSLALGSAMLGIPAVASALEAGDEDLDSSIALAALANVPTLVDESLATKNALAMMDTAGMRATLGQRAKLAGGLLSYLAVPIGLGITGNALGNIYDEDLETPGELSPQ